MSGTSVDAVDACAVRLTWTGENLIHELVQTHTEPFPPTLQARVLACLGAQSAPLAEICALNADLGELFARAALAVVPKAEPVVAIGSHGQTVYHQPPHNGLLGCTLQLGEPSVIAERTGIRTVANFRPRDMAAGGHGAPLVCLADTLLFPPGTAVQNIGGIANVTVLPADNRPPFAFDTGPGNMLIDAAMRHFYSQPFDADGHIAASGQVQTMALTQWLAEDPYFHTSPPKTTGRERYGQAFFERLLAQHPDWLPADWVATLTAFTVHSIARAYQHHVGRIDRVVVGGGGGRNPVLMNGLRQAMAPTPVALCSEYGVDSQYKEAMAFAILAWATVTGRPGNVPSCTGAAQSVILGGVYL
jgi:anhydro-N-acetylmuramic acid kinase